MVQVVADPIFFFFFLIKNIILIEIISQLQFESVYLNFNKYSRLDNFIEIKFVSNNLLVKYILHIIILFNSRRKLLYVICIKFES